VRAEFVVIAATVRNPRAPYKQNPRFQADILNSK